MNTQRESQSTQSALKDGRPAVEFTATVVDIRDFRRTGKQTTFQLVLDHYPLLPEPGRMLQGFLIARSRHGAALRVEVSRSEAGPQGLWLIVDKPLQPETVVRGALEIVEDSCGGVSDISAATLPIERPCSSC